MSDQYTHFELEQRKAHLERELEAAQERITALKLELEAAQERITALERELHGGDMEIKNAVIDDARITSDDHGLLSAYLTLDYGGCCQCFGGYALYLPKSFAHHKMESVAGHFIWRVMAVAGVTEWKNLIGKTIRVKSTHSGVEAIGHIVKDDWFFPCDDFLV